MELDETLLHQRFDDAVSDLRPDVMALVGTGEQRGLALRRRRRWQTGGSALAVLALVGGGAYLSGAGVFDQRSAQPTNSQQLVDATPRGLAAGLVDLVDLGTPTDVGGERHRADGSSGETLQAGAAYRVDGQRLSIEVIASRPVTQWASADSCAKAQSGGGQGTIWCDDSPLADGTPALRVLMGQSDTVSSGPSPISYAAIVAVKRDGQLVAVIETLPPDAGQPAYTETNLPVSIDVLSALATDPRIGFFTTQDYNAAGEQLADFKNSLLISSGSSTSGSATASSETTVPSESAQTNSGSGSSGQPQTPPMVTVQAPDGSGSSSSTGRGSAGPPASTP